MLPYVIVVLVLIIGGLVVVVLSPKAPGVLLQKVALVVGCVFFVAGLLLAVAPIVDWLAKQVWDMLNGGK